MQGKINKANRKIVAGKVWGGETEGKRGREGRKNALWWCISMGDGDCAWHCIGSRGIYHSNTHSYIGTCLLLAAKFFTDIKRAEIKQLIEVKHTPTLLLTMLCGFLIFQRITDVFRISSKELILYELPVLVSLQFSLLTPAHQALSHYEKLKEFIQTWRSFSLIYFGVGFCVHVI